MERKHLIIIIVVTAVVVLALVVGLVLYFVLRSDEGSGGGSILGIYDKAAVATNGHVCAGIGSDIMKKGGNAVEAAIAALFCEGVVCCQSMGIGGGFLMTIYFRDKQKAVSLIARETAPAASTEDMYGTNSYAMVVGAKAGGIPGQLKGYQELFDKYKSGNVEWKDLVYPSVKLCKEGFKVQWYLAAFMPDYLSSEYNQKEFRDLLTNPETGKAYVRDEIMKQPALGETLTQIAEKGVDVFYKGELGEKFIADLTELGGIMTVDDLKNYEIRWEEPISAKLSGNGTLYTVPLPGSGPVIAFVMNILDGFIPASDKTTTYQRIVEALKHGYGRRTQLGDPHGNENILEVVQNLTSKSYAESVRSEISDSKTYNDPGHYGAVLSTPETNGTAHLSVIGPNGDAVAVTSTINAIFGARVMSKSTGIILNCEMADFCAPGIESMFGIPPSPANFIQPGRRPLSSMVPSIFVNNNGDVRLIAGAAGGSRITSAVTQVLVYNLWLDKNIKQALDQRRIQHQLFPMKLKHESRFDTEVLEGLQKIGHEIIEGGANSLANGIEVRNGKIYASSDHRHSGMVDGF